MAQKKKSTSSKPTGKAKRSSRSAISVVTNARKPLAERVAALTKLALTLTEQDEDLQVVLNILRDQAEPSEMRLTALQTLQAASFSVINFESCRGDYIATLREISDDPDPELRQRVLGILAREKDGFAQEKLLEGLKNSEKALVSPEKALQLLSYDVHAEAYPVAREIVDHPPNADARREALRLLTADADSASMFEKILLDKGEATDIRQMSASALHAIKPEKLQEYAREIVLDDSEDEELQATSLAALTHFGDSSAIAKDEELLKRVDDMRNKAPTTVNEGARQLLDKYGR